MAQKTLKLEYVKAEPRYFQKDKWRVLVMEPGPCPSGNGSIKSLIVDIMEARELSTVEAWIVSQGFPEDTIFDHPCPLFDGEADTPQKRRWWYIRNYGSVRMWGVASVAMNWRLRKRLPRLTLMAVDLGYIDPHNVRPN